jgi:hypothetical protein
MAGWVVALLEILAKSSLVLVVALQRIPSGFKVGFRLGVYDLIPTAHEFRPLVSHCLLLFLGLCLRSPLF